MRSRGVAKLRAVGRVVRVARVVVMGLGGLAKVMWVVGVVSLGGG